MITATSASVKAAPMRRPIFNVKKGGVKKNVFAQNNLQMYAKAASIIFWLCSKLETRERRPQKRQKIHVFEGVLG